MSFFSRVFRSKDSTATKKQSKPVVAADPVPAKPKWTDAWTRTEVAPEEVQDLIRGCAQELKARGKHSAGIQLKLHFWFGLVWIQFQSNHVLPQIPHVHAHSFGSLIIRLLALDTPFLLLPFRPSSDPSAARTFVRNYFNQSFDQGRPVSGDGLVQELRLNEPMVRNIRYYGYVGEYN